MPFVRPDALPIKIPNTYLSVNVTVALSNRHS